MTENHIKYQSNDLIENKQINYLIRKLLIQERKLKESLLNFFIDPFDYFDGLVGYAKHLGIECYTCFDEKKEVFSIWNNYGIVKKITLPYEEDKLMDQRKLKNPAEFIEVNFNEVPIDWRLEIK